MSLVRLINGRQPNEDDISQIMSRLGVDIREARSTRDSLEREATWKLNTRLLHQEGVIKGSLPLVVDTLTKNTEPEEFSKIMFESLSNMSPKEIQVYETILTDKDMEYSGKDEKTTVKNFLRKKSSRASLRADEETKNEKRTVNYNLTIFTKFNRSIPQQLDLCRVEVLCEVVPSQSKTHSLITNRQLLRLSALEALLSDTRLNPRQATARIEPIIIWRERGRLPSLHVNAANFGDLKLLAEPTIEKRTCGKTEFEEELQIIAKISGQHEQEIVTRLGDYVLTSSCWETQLHQIWSLPIANADFTYCILVFLKGGIYYKCKVDAILGREGEILSRHLESCHVDILKITCLRKLSEECKELDLRLELPGGRDVKKVPLPPVSQTRGQPLVRQSRVEETSPDIVPPKGLFSWWTKTNDDNSKLNSNHTQNNNDSTTGGASLQTQRHRKQTLVGSPSEFIVDEVSNFEADLNHNNSFKTRKDTLQVPGQFQLPDKLNQQSYAGNTVNSPGRPSLSRSPSRKVSTCLEPHQPPGDSHPLPIPINPQQRPPLSRAPSVMSNGSQDSRRSSVILDLREAINESGKRLSLIVAENQQKALQALLDDLQDLTPKRKLMYGAVCVVFFFLVVYLVSQVWNQALYISDTMMSQLSHLSDSHSSQLSQLSSRLNSMESLVEQLVDRDVSTQMDILLNQLKEGQEGNNLKFAVMDRLVAELTAIERAITALQEEVEKSGETCSWSPLAFLTQGDEQ